MKCITYVSKVVARQNGATIPTGLSQIFRSARKNNVYFNITGVLSYRNGYYIQVLEGNNEDIDRLFSMIASDSRHEQVVVLLDFPISERSFAEWDMKLLESVQKDSRFLSFVQKYNKQISSLSNGQLETLGHFYKPGSLSNEKLGGYNAKDLMLNAWPDFRVVKQTPVIIELCARLTKQPYPYASLLDSGHFGTQKQLDKILNGFETLGILRVTQAGNDGNNANGKQQPNRFYLKMKDFLRLS